MSEFASMGHTFSNGITGQPITVRSADPSNFYQAVSDPDQAPVQDIFGMLYIPSGATSPLPVVIVVPGSLGVAVSHLAHAETFTDMGIAACVIDPFGARSVTSTVANQTQYSFAASGWDVLATVEELAKRDDIDASRIGAQGHSRGGSAVLTAASRGFSSKFEQQLAAVYAAYPWSGHQFLNPDIGDTKVRAVVGDQDEWCLPQQVQGHVQAMSVYGGDASWRIFAGCQHSFDRAPGIEFIDDASVSPGAPTCYIDSAGAFIHPVTSEADASLSDRDLMVYALKAGYGVKGAQIGSSGNQAQQFKEDMIDFWKAQFVS